MRKESFDVVVIGGGPGGYVAALRASQLGLKTACVEKRPVMGGTCLNVGCIPSKTLLYASSLYAKLAQEGKDWGITTSSLTCDLSQMMEKKKQVIHGFNEGIAALLRKNQVTPFHGLARLLSPNSVKITQDGASKDPIEIQARHILLATGSEPTPLPFLPFDGKMVLSSTEALSLPQIPKRLLIIGAGIIGVELGSIYNRLGCAVEFVEFQERICPTLDESLSKGLLQSLTKQGMQFHLSTKVEGAVLEKEEVLLKLSSKEIRTPLVLVAIGRRPYTQGLGLQEIGIHPDAKGFIPVDGAFRTSVPSIFAIGDLIDGPMLAHKASEEGVAVAELIAGDHPSLEYPLIPSVVYTDPEVASVGLREEEAKARSIPVKVGMFPFKANSRARTAKEDEGFVKILADAKTDRLLGVHILGAHASELISTAVVALSCRMTSLQLAKLPYAHPTLAEALKEAALDLHKQALHK